MPRGIQRAKKDGNQKEIEAKLKLLNQKTGGRVTYFDTSALGRGFPDLTVGVDGANLYYEIKEECKNPLAKLTPAEQGFMASWSGHYRVVTSYQEICEELRQWGSEIERAIKEIGF
jgi:hypothetical protein